MDKKIALIGSPNTGKTTLFNWLTGLRHKTVNFPGATVEYASAPLFQPLNLNKSEEISVEIIDTPGIYGLDPKSEDEIVTSRILNDPSFGITDIVVVVDSSQLDRTLNLVDQAFRLHKNVTIALTMTDLLRSSNIKLNLELLEQHYKAKFIEIDGTKGKGVAELVQEITKTNVNSSERWAELGDLSYDLTSTVLRNKNLAKLVFSKDLKKPIHQQTISKKIDKWVLHPLFGPVIFFTVMSILFSGIYWVAAPLMDLVEQLFGYFGALSSSYLTSPLLGDFFENGVFGSIGSVMVFVPQIFVLFISISLLEQSGFLARAATIIDRPLQKIGMGGRSFVPLLSGFACAIPATMAARNIPSKKDRMITMFIIPMMTCSARIPVYALFLSFLFKDEPPWKAGVAMSILFLFAIAIGGISAGFLNLILSKHLGDIGKGRLTMELPLYRWPTFHNILIQPFMKTVSYVKRAGVPIFIFSALIWGLSTFPNYQLDDQTAKLETSYLGITGKTLEPLFKPIGADWRVGISLLSAFAAREVFVSSLAVVFHISSEDEELAQNGLLNSMKEAKNSEGEPLFSVPTILALLFFVMIALQCTTTTAIVAKETGSWKFSIIQLVSLNILAYLISFLVYSMTRTIL